MTTQGVLLRVRMTGGPPFGLRFMGGGGSPVCISKIRRKSKAFNAKLQEGDEVISVNGHNVRNVGRDVAMGYVDATVDTLDLEIVRRSHGGQTIPINASSTQHVNGSAETRRVPTYQISPAAQPQRQQGTPQKKLIPTITHVQTREEPAEGEGMRRGNTVSFNPPKINVAAKPAVWSPGGQSQQVKKAPLAYSTSAPAHTTSAHVQYGVGGDQENQPSYRKVVPLMSAPLPKTKTPFQESHQNASPKPVRWEPQIQVSNKPRMEDSSSTTTWSGNVSGPRRTSVGKEVTITFAPQLPSQSKRLSTDSGVPPSPITPVKEEPIRITSRAEIQNKPQIPVQIKEEPTVILRRAAPSTDTTDSKRKLKPDTESKRPYSYPGKHSEDDPEISTEMRMKACKTIADLLMFPADKHAKGARMFAKRRKRSDRWSVEGQGQKSQEDEEEDEEPKAQPVEITLVSSGRKPLPPGAVPIGMPLPPPPPPPEPGQGSAIPVAPPPPPPGTKYRLKVEPTNFKVNLKSKEKCAHDIVSPEEMGRLVVDLKSATGRGANMFERRRQRSDQFVIDETNAKPPPVLKKPDKPKGYSSAQIKMKQDNQMLVPKKSPWEAAMESPVGNCDEAFHHIKPKRPSLTQVDSSTTKGHGAPQPKPKPPAAWMTTSKIVPDVQSKALSEPPKIKPKFNANDPKSIQQTATASPISKPAFNAKKHSADSKPQDFNPKPRGWNSPVNSGETTPTSQTSMNSAEDIHVGLGSIFPTKPAKYSTGFSDYNRKPRGWGNSNEPQPNAATNGRPASYLYGSKPSPMSVHSGRADFGNL